MPLHWKGLLSLMKICYFDAFSGISGDMAVGALLDAGADWDATRAALQSLQLGAEVSFERTKRKGMAAGKFSVKFEDQKKHRHLPHIEKIIAAGELTEGARQKASAVFRALGEAEAKSHNVPIEKVHFHEVGAVDSICDIVGACVALDLLGIEEVHASRINVGSGTVNTEHGVLPVPAPATTELLKDMPVYAAGPETELTTPTGAAILAALGKSFGPVPAMRVIGQGFGAGDKDFQVQANVLRVLVGERTAATEATTVEVIEANIDDTTPQVIGYAMERLLAAGALDVTLSPLFMKKNRPATQVTVLATPEHTEALIHILFAETTTLGVRTHQAQRRVLWRQIESVETRFGPIRIKHSEGGHFAPEFDDCKQAALTHAVPLRDVIAEANLAFSKQQ